jgi:uncharacterized protein (DUF2252 family)
VHAFDPVELAKAQLASDRKKTARFPALYERKIARMSASPLAFLRGAAPMFYQMLAARPELAKGPPGEGWLTGDLHLENFGAYRPDHGSYDDHKHGHKHGSAAPIATFNLNDFDDAFVGPWRFDVLRLMTSLVLGGRELGADGRRALDLCYLLLDAYVGSACGKPRQVPVPRPVEVLIEQVHDRTRAELLQGRTVIVRGSRRLARGERYRDLPRSIVAKVPAAFARYAAKLDPAEKPHEDELSILDVALRVAGTGSLGGLRIAVLVRGKGGTDGSWLFDMKEQGTPSASVLVGKRANEGMDGATRVATSIKACLEHPPRMIGVSKLGTTPLFVRRLSPQEDKLELVKLRDADLNALATYLGTLVGTAHHRGATKPAKPWSAADCDGMVDRAITVAGIHEGVYLALCKLTRSTPARR